MDLLGIYVSSVATVAAVVGCSMLGIYVRKEIKARRADPMLYGLIFYVTTGVVLIVPAAWITALS